ncbi:hypothetical protein [Roseateles toxinivorans]|uniref:hypothetical protein n=1 Tax=Roseateles toxinivorans TaxID=270368 RepID=UPI001FB5E71E|nr:hypothetical protein [Roseateles toxinivorans]
MLVDDEMRGHRAAGLRLEDVRRSQRRFDQEQATAVVDRAVDADHQLILHARNGQADLAIPDCQSNLVALGQSLVEFLAGLVELVERELVALIAASSRARCVEAVRRP